MEFKFRPNLYPTDAAEREALVADPKFGQVFTDHMITIRYTKEAGWHDALVGPREPIQVSPAAAILHYGQEIFEGVKAYRRQDKKIGFFRADANARRFVESARRMQMAPLPTETFLEALSRLASIDQGWIPSSAEGSLYLRPFQFATDATLQAKPSDDYLFSVIASPVKAYFSGGIKPISIWASQQYTRAAPGGTGTAKFGGNYGGAMVAQQEAAEHGCDQVVFLDAVEREYIDEMGGMNIFMVTADGTLITPELNDSILAGITRDSLITLARAEGRVVEERRISLSEWRDRSRSGEIVEAFACGTAAVVVPIGRVRMENGEFELADGQPGPVSTYLRQSLVDIQFGQTADPFGWTTVLP
jgi:branched-chain amino acid aminotransferase